MMARAASRPDPVDYPAAVKYGVLSLLCEGPGYGRELFRGFKERVGDSWGLSLQSVYDALESLERGGLARVVAGTRGKTPVYYEIVDDGRRERLRWLRTPPSRAPVREEFYLKVAFSTSRELPMLIEASYELERGYVEELEARAELPSFEELARGLAPWDRIAPVMVRDVHSERVQSEIRSLQRVRATMEWMLKQREGTGRRS
jgi:DNA-binding PadR family transcriptional regulator